MANARTRTVPVEGAIAAFHSELNSFAHFRIAHLGIFILHVFITLIGVLLHAQQ